MVGAGFGDETKHREDGGGLIHQRSKRVVIGPTLLANEGRWGDRQHFEEIQLRPQGGAPANGVRAEHDYQGSGGETATLRSAQCARRENERARGGAAHHARPRTPRVLANSTAKRERVGTVEPRPDPPLKQHVCRTADE